MPYIHGGGNLYNIGSWKINQHGSFCREANAPNPPPPLILTPPPPLLSFSTGFVTPNLAGLPDMNALYAPPKFEGDVC